MFGSFDSSMAARLLLSIWAEIQAIDGDARSQPLPPAAFSLLRQSSLEE
jgi:hypothetical protein